MFDAYLRRVKERLLFPWTDILGRHLHPNTLTLIGFFVGLLSVCAILFQYYLPGLLLWLLNRLLDGLDGSVARRMELQSDYGGYLDIFLDFIIYALIPIAFCFQLYLTRDPDLLQRSLACIVLLASFYLNSVSCLYLSALMDSKCHKSKNEHYTTLPMPPGIVEGGETIFFYTLFFLFPRHLSLLFLVMASLIYLGLVQRLLWARKHLV